MQVFSHSEAGYNHQNQDAILAKPLSDEIFVCLLADGQGGQTGGKEAAQIAIESAWDEAKSRPLKALRDKFTWCEIIASADESVEKNACAGFTTLIALAISQNHIYGASVGDSMTLLVKPKHAVNITARQNKNPPIGSSAAMAKPFEVEFHNGDKLLVMSDGVWRYVSEETIGEAARIASGDELIQKLRQMQTRQNAGNLPDDFSVILVEN